MPITTLAHIMPIIGQSHTTTHNIIQQHITHHITTVRLLVVQHHIKRTTENHTTIYNYNNIQRLNANTVVFSGIANYNVKQQKTYNEKP